MKGSKAMENADLKTQALAFKLVVLLSEAGAAGLTRTQLLQKTCCRTADLTAALKFEGDQYNIVSRQMRKSEFGLGRQPRRYWFKDFAPKEMLTAAPPPAIPVLELGEAPPKGGTCRQCGGAIQSRGPGRLPDYCSPACRSLHSEGGVTLGRFMDRAQDPRVFAQLAILLVSMDLIARGFRVALDLLINGPQIIVHDGVNPVFLHVVPVSNAGYLPPDDTYERVAAVYRDGRIAYGGRDPLVFAGEVASDGIEPEGETSNNTKNAEG